MITQIRELADAARPMCSLITRDSGEDPIGSISGYARYLIVEIALPWAGNIADSPRFPVRLRDVLERHAAQGGDTRFQGIVPDAVYSRDGFTRMLDLQRPPLAGAAFTPTAYLVPTASLAACVDEILHGPGHGSPWERFRVENEGRDLLVCTHGTKDACCASFGYPAYRVLRPDLARQASGPLRVWRVNHLGGHRFAPTMLDFPEGRCWGYLDDDTLGRIVRHDDLLPELRQHYRGWTLLGSFAEMHVEREIFAREGWDWTRNLVHGQTRDEGSGRQTVRLAFQSPDGRVSGAYTAMVEPTGDTVISRASCSDDAPRETRVHRVSHLTRVDNGLLVPSDREQPAHAW
jgi:hypothetical protein